MLIDLPNNPNSVTYNSVNNPNFITNDLMKAFLFVMLLVLTTTFVKAQEKIEREYRIDAISAPQTAQNFVAAFQKGSRIKWIKEINAEGNSVEAKFKADGKRYSIEFSEQGILEDVEVIITFSEMPEDVKDKIQKHLKEAFDYYKVEKIQAQYRQSEKEILAWRTSNNVLKPLYELVVKSRNSGEKAQRFEFLFDTDGNFVERAKVISRSDNILRF